MACKQARPERPRRLTIFSLLLASICSPASVTLAASDGDLNGDSQTGSADLLWGTQALTGLRTLTAPQEQHGDIAPLVNGYSVPDGRFNLGDLAVLYRIVMDGMLPPFAGVPANQFSIGDSIGVAEAANGTIGQAHPETVWSTGYNASDSVASLNERLETLLPASYYENSAARNSTLNHAVSGAVMADFASQAQAVISSTSQVPASAAGDVVVFLGNNDVCADSLAQMTAPALFEAQYRSGLDTLAASPATRDARIDVISIPAIYWLWNAKYASGTCRFIWLLGSVCQSLLANAQDDCLSTATRLDPDHIDPQDGSNCRRRKQFHQAIRDTYNPILQNVLQEYIDGGQLPNARFTNIFDIQFTSAHVNNGDCFHPNVAGHALLADTAWCRSPLGAQDAACTN
jgi:lysophospholipase L1-like esterase